MSVLVSQGTNEWYTPPHIIELARATMGGIDLDPASNAVAQEWVRAGAYYSADDVLSGLARIWWGRIWLNPPFDQTRAWVDRLDSAYRSGEIEQAVLLVNSAPGYVWWERIWRERPVCMLRERLRFIRPDGTAGGQAKKGQTVAFFGPDASRFRMIWADVGRVILPDSGGGIEHERQSYGLGDWPSDPGGYR